MTGSAQFQAGLAAGTVAVALVLVAASVVAGRRRPALAGAAFALASLAALDGWGPLDAARPLSDGAVAGVLLLLLVGTAADVVAVPGYVVAALALPGAVAIARDIQEVRPPWIAPAVAAAIVVGGSLAGTADRAHERSALGPLWLVVFVGGVYIAVPDTEGARALLGAALPLVLLTLPWPVARLGRGGSLAAVGVVLHDAALEGAARSPAVIGAIASLGLLVCAPIGPLLFRRLAARSRAVQHGRGQRRSERVGRRGRRNRHAPRDRVREQLSRVVVGVALQLAVVAWGARVVGLQRSPGAALAFAAPMALLGPWLALGLDPPDVTGDAAPRRARRRSRRHA